MLIWTSLSVFSSLNYASFHLEKVGRLWGWGRLIFYPNEFFIIVWFFLKCVIPFSKNKKDIFLVRIVFAAKLSNVGEFIRILSTSLFGVFSCMMMCSTIKRSTVFMTTISKSQFYVITLVTFHYGIKIFYKICKMFKQSRIKLQHYPNVD